MKAIPRWVWWSISGITVLIIGAGIWYVVSIGNADKGSSTQEVATSNQGSQAAIPAKKKSNPEVQFESQGYKYGLSVRTIERSKEGASPGNVVIRVYVAVHNLQTDRSAPR